ncbi:Uma2 family endonuclease [Euhalothece natronophila Z-M001]|uniref:Uma2 family endonuclease n=1 Tax=Euhalothece natronophila Z-M001 TaxID=522448 RepID=A0A5B8NRT1_9CHRO|nr:Uma2 family endonuclease [Euhalothece natronophila]QDZ40790.1 Uma2 family endonuclease [Euhalothece natronophila Z-M001]
MLSSQTQSQLSLEEFLKLPETKPAQEYIDGKIYQKSMPNGKHSRLQTRLATEINQVAEGQGLASAFTELRCTFSGRSIVPDITVFTWDKIPINEAGEIENTFNIAPNWTIEILSPEQSSTRVINNILFCLDQGSELGWLIDPDEKLVMTFFPEQQPKAYQNHNDILPYLSILPEFKLSVETIFSYLKLK